MEGIHPVYVIMNKSIKTLECFPLLIRAAKTTIQILALYGIFLAGNWIQQTFNLIVPGSVIGMIIFFILLLTKGIKVTWMEEGTKLIVNHLTLFFIPATVGVINYFDLFYGKGLLVILIVLISTILVMGISARVSQRLMRKKELQHD